MRFSYEVYEHKQDGPSRIDTGIRVELVNLLQGQWIEITDNLHPEKQRVIIKSQDELDEWLQCTAMQLQWIGREERDNQRKLLSEKVHKTDRGDAINATISTMQRQPFDMLEETDGFRVKIPEEILLNPPAPNEALKRAASLTLGQLKLEDANVKTAVAAKKPRMAAVPPIAIMALGTAMQTGADKYGLFNWRGTSVTATVFYNAMLRHLQQWYSGEQHASDTGVHHLAHLMGGAAIILDAEMNNVFIDDRPKGEILGDDYAKHFMKVSDDV